jgi:hypothetical protein
MPGAYIKRKSQGALLPALAAFNIGVEIGQVAIVALIFPLLLWSDSSPFQTRAHDRFGHSRRWHDLTVSPPSCR